MELYFSALIHPNNLMIFSLSTIEVRKHVHKKGYAKALKEFLLEASQRLNQMRAFVDPNENGPAVVDRSENVPAFFF